MPPRPSLALPATVVLIALQAILATRLVDSGSGYNAQNTAPVHIGVGSVARIDIEVTWPGNGRRSTTRLRSLDTAPANPAVILKID